MGTESTVVLRAILRDELTAALKSISGEMNSVAETAKTAGGAMTQSFGVAAPTIRGVTDELAKNVARLEAQAAAMKRPEYAQYLEQQKALKKEIAQMTDAQDANGVSWTRIASIYYTSSQIAGTLAAGIMSVTHAAAEYDSIRMRLKAVEGSSIISEKDFKMIQEMAKMPGLGFGEAANAFTGLRSLRVAGTEAANIIKGLAEANAAMGGGAEAFGRVMYQVQQSVGVGKLMGEDLRAIKEAIPNIGALMQDAYGTADAEAINKRLQESGKSVKDFWAEMANMAHGLPPAGETITNNLDNIGDSLKKIKAGLIDTESIKTATHVIGESLDWLGDHIKTFEAVASGATALFSGNAGGVIAALAQLTKDKELEETSQSMGAASFAQWQKGLADREKEKANLAADAKRKANDDRINDAKKEAKRVAEEIHKAEVDADKYVTRTGTNEVTLREGVGFGEEESRRAAQRDREAAERADKKAMEERARERERIKKEIQRVDLEIAREEESLERTQTKIVKAELHQRLEEQREYYRNWRELATTSIDSVAQTLIFGEGSLTKKMEAIMQRAESSLLSSGIAMLVNSGMAYMTGGASLAAGPVGFNILSGLAEMFGGRAGGGDAIGPRLVGEKRAEVFTPLVPGTIHNTTHNYGGITVVLPNVRNAQDLARDLPRATRSAASNRRQTSV